MTDKQIIIDGVDVCGCEFYQIEANELYPKANYCGSMRNTFCEIEPNCYYKQLKRKEQECEELKKELMKNNEVDTFFNTPIEGWSNDPCEICPHKAENEQLKDELSAIQHNCNREGCRYYDDNTFKVFYECKAQKALQLSANSVTTKYCDLLKTLTEIKEIAEENIRIADLEGLNGVYRRGLAKQIMQKCEEVNDEH